MTGKCMCMCVIVWHKSSLTASNSLSCGSCWGAGAWWPIPPAPYFSFNDAQINSSTLFQNSSSPHPSSSRRSHLCSSLPRGRCSLQLIIVAYLPDLHFLQPFMVFSPLLSLFLTLPQVCTSTCPYQRLLSPSAVTHFARRHRLFTGAKPHFCTIDISCLSLSFAGEGVRHARTFVLTFRKAHLRLAV